MKSQDKIYTFLKKNKGRAYCDFCVAKATTTDPNEVMAIAGTMRLFPEEFTRRRGRCVTCKGDGKMVTASM